MPSCRVLPRKGSCTALLACRCNCPLPPSTHTYHGSNVCVCAHTHASARMMKPKTCMFGMCLEQALKPAVQIIGVEPTGANAMAQSLARGERIALSRVDSFADGVAVKQVCVCGVEGVCLQYVKVHP